MDPNHILLWVLKTFDHSEVQGTKPKLVFYGNFQVLIRFSSDIMWSLKAPLEWMASSKWLPWEEPSLRPHSLSPLQSEALLLRSTHPPSLGLCSVHPSQMWQMCNSALGGRKHRNSALIVQRKTFYRAKEDTELSLWNQGARRELALQCLVQRCCSFSEASRQ